ncbi:hypothetical protein MLD38_025088 [Melastoma candidum]|uniref:Uncharacterized protein n=1 Tax=Melastoma candidum TaxID=119954 RepID=A0ACB9NU80_9MYRT|nr:hypothetical protein MLD38_025088 [Melastoma candidum]
MQAAIAHDGATIAWFREEFAAANAIIDALCSHLSRLGDRYNKVNVVKGLKLYEDVFNDLELEKLTHFVNRVRAAGRNGKLSDGKQAELIQFGVPIFRLALEGSSEDNKLSKTKHNDHPYDLCLPLSIEPNDTICIPRQHRAYSSSPATSCRSPRRLEVDTDLQEAQQITSSISSMRCLFVLLSPRALVRGESSQPFLKPPHLDQSVSTLLLSDSTMVFGRFLMSDIEGNYKGPLMLSLKKGSLVVMRGNSAEMARHVMCPGPNKRVAIIFFRVRPDSHQVSSPTGPSPTGAMTLWQPQSPSTNSTPCGALTGYEALDMIPSWGILHAPVVMLAGAPICPMVLSPKKVQQEGTGMFLPWSVSPPRKPLKHLPPWAQKGRFLKLPLTGRPLVLESTS